MHLITQSENQELAATQLAPPECAPAETIYNTLMTLAYGQEGLVGLTALGLSTHPASGSHSAAGHASPPAASSLRVRNSLHPATKEGLWSLARLATRLSPNAQSLYVTLNPVSDHCNSTPKNTDILARRGLLVDVDPMRPPDSNATHTEKTAALAVTHAARNWLSRQFQFPTPLLADSGNGYHLLYPVELPANETSSELVRLLLRAVATECNSPFACVDLKVYDARRLVKLYGTVARKGPHSPSRPQRRSALLERPSPPLRVVSLALLQAVAQYTPTSRKTTQITHPPNLDTCVSSPVNSGTIGGDTATAYAHAALEQELAVLATTVAGNRNNQLFASAASLFELVNTGNLIETEVTAALEQAGRQLGLPQPEIQTVLGSAKRTTAGKARNLSHLKTAQRTGTSRTGSKRSHAPASASASKDTETAGSSAPEPDTQVREKYDDPHRLARRFLAACCTHPDGPTLLHWNGEWWSWAQDIGRWATLPEHELMSMVTCWVKQEVDRLALEQNRFARPLSTRIVGNVTHMLRSLVTVPVAALPAAPAWLRPQPGDPDASQCLPTRNAIVDLPSLFTNPEATTAIRPISPRLFATNTLDYPFDLNPPAPESWLNFLQSVWGDDVASIETLQEWLGYLLTPNTSQQRILLILGPRRSGKGTLARTLRSLVGEANVAAPTLSSLAGPFGLQPLIGKTVCLCPESRLTGRIDTQAIVERLLSVSGEDPQSVERKHLTPWHGTLSCRFVLLGNEFPRLSDYSDAILGRLVVLKLTKSWQGKEDLDLGSRLEAELPGILIWAIAGWHRLQARRRFKQPETGQIELLEAAGLINPVGAFVHECCLIGPDHKATATELYQAWKDWCQRNGREHPGDIPGFARNLKAQPELSLVEHRPNATGIRTRYYVGLTLKPNEEAEF